jgi:hypothetical protein
MEILSNKGFQPWDSCILILNARRWRGRGGVCVSNYFQKERENESGGTCFGERVGWLVCFSGFASLNVDKSSR